MTRPNRTTYIIAADAVARSLRDGTTVYLDHTPALARALDAIVELEGGLALKNHRAGQLYAGGPGNAWRVALRAS